MLLMLHFAAFHRSSPLQSDLFHQKTKLDVQDSHERVVPTYCRARSAIVLGGP